MLNRSHVTKDAQGIPLVPCRVIDIPCLLQPPQQADELPSATCLGQNGKPRRYLSPGLASPMDFKGSSLPPGLSSRGLGPEPELRATTLPPSLCSTYLASGGRVEGQHSSLTCRWTHQLQACSPQTFSSPTPTPRAPETDRVEHCIPKGAPHYVLWVTLCLPNIAKAGDQEAKQNCIHHGDSHWPPPFFTAAFKEPVAAGGGTRRPGPGPGEAWDGIHVLLTPKVKSLLSELWFPHLYSQRGPLCTIK